jgi:hypothetical protein
LQGFIRRCMSKKCGMRLSIDMNRAWAPRQERPTCSMPAGGCANFAAPVTASRTGAPPWPLCRGDSSAHPHIHTPHRTSRWEGRNHGNGMLSLCIRRYPFPTHDFYPCYSPPWCRGSSEILPLKPLEPPTSQPLSLSRRSSRWVRL